MGRSAYGPYTGYITPFPQSMWDSTKLSYSIIGSTRREGNRNKGKITTEGSSLTRKPVTRSLIREFNKLVSEPVVMGDQREELRSMLQESQALNEARFAQMEAQLNLSKQLQELLAVSNRSRGKKPITSSSSQPTSVNKPDIRICRYKGRGDSQIYKARFFSI